MNGKYTTPTGQAVEVLNFDSDNKIVYADFGDERKWVGEMEYSLWKKEGEETTAPEEPQEIIPEYVPEVVVEEEPVVVIEESPVVEEKIVPEKTISEVKVNPITQPQKEVKKPVAKAPEKKVIKPIIKKKGK